MPTTVVYWFGAPSKLYDGGGAHPFVKVSTVLLPSVYFYRTVLCLIFIATGWHRNSNPESRYGSKQYSLLELCG